MFDIHFRFLYNDLMKRYIHFLDETQEEVIRDTQDGRNLATVPLFEDADMITAALNTHNDMKAAGIHVAIADINQWQT